MHWYLIKYKIIFVPIRLLWLLIVYEHFYCKLYFFLFSIFKPGTIHIHSVAKVLMAKGFSSQILDFLVWSCVAMESSVPLMTVKYLSWRCQLYSTTCLCFYDLKSDQAGEEFARRGLIKVCLCSWSNHLMFWVLAYNWIY